MKLASICLGAAMLLWLPVALAQEAGTRQEKEQEQRTEVRKEVGEAVDAIRHYSIERRNDAVAAARRAMEDADRTARRLEARLAAERERMDAAARQRSQEAMADLRRDRAEMSARAAELQHASGEAWGQARQQFVDSYHAFLAAVDRVRARLDRGPHEDRQADTEEEEEEEEEEEP